MSSISIGHLKWQIEASNAVSKLSENVHPTIAPFLIYRKNELNNFLYGIFLKYFNENYQRTLIHEMRIPSE